MLKRLKTARDNILFIHYSCESLSDENQGLSPRISGIAITNYSTSVTKSFAIHLVAEKRGIDKNDIPSRFEELEKVVVTDFFDYVRERTQYFWVHWNMNSSVFGFEALAHRYEALTGLVAPEIDEVKRFNLIEIISNKYGSDSIDDPKMQNLVKLNVRFPRDFLTGFEESQSLQRGEYVKLHKSTICKTYFFRTILEYLLEGRRIKTNHSSLMQKVDILLEHTLFKVLGALAVLWTLANAIILRID